MRRPLLPFLLLAAGAVFLLIGVGAGIRTALFLHGAARTTGTISDQTPVTSSVMGRRPSTTYRPTLSFQTPDGHWVVVTSSVSTSSAHASGGHWVDTTPKVHDRVPVVYDPGNPNHAEIASFFRLWGVSLVFAILGLAFAGFGGIFGSLARRA